VAQASKLDAVEWPTDRFPSRGGSAGAARVYARPGRVARPGIGTRDLGRRRSERSTRRVTRSESVSPASTKSDAGRVRNWTRWSGLLTDSHLEEGLQELLECMLDLDTRDLGRRRSERSTRRVTRSESVSPASTKSDACWRAVEWPTDRFPSRGGSAGAARVYARPGRVAAQAGPRSAA
jgi:hypothetical protein